MGAFQRERRAPPSTRVYSRRAIRRPSSARKNRPAASTDGGIRLINISVDSGPDSCRDEKLARFRVTKEGRKEDGSLTEVWKQFLGIDIRRRREMALKTSPSSAYIKMHEYIGTRCDFIPRDLTLLRLYWPGIFFTTVILS